MKKKIIKLLLKILFTKKELVKINDNLVDILAYLAQLDSYFTLNRPNRKFCLDIARIRKWLLHKVCIYFYNDDEIKIMIDTVNKIIINHIDNNRYTKSDKEFVDKYKQNIVKLDDIIEQ